MLVAVRTLSDAASYEETVKLGVVIKYEKSREKQPPAGIRMACVCRSFQPAFNYRTVISSSQILYLYASGVLARKFSDLELTS